ncbi:M50 family metallopeptidase [Pelagicoccus mobilis]|uniref:M50 family metallopeptidase n=1 Tax=Pelagicoccus mobilis TaxID=415221 RepID=A0A934RUA1_9BACT|nr:M50 family metallopeptidase [Pelagicoccus mobilis]MBK1875234.1 M50 family metallopeptidase [Pelagicoccus mobilis]
MLLVGKLVCLIACYLGGIVSGVFLHELGHSVMALLTTRQKVALEVGSAGARKELRLGRLELVGRSRGLRYGATRYDRESESRGVQAVVAIGGPLASSLAVLLFAWLLVNSVVGDWVWIVWLGLLVANFRILIVAVWPIEYRPDGPEGEVWLSDGLDLWRLLTSKHD